MTQTRPERWRPFRDRSAMLDHERALVAEITEVEDEQRRLAERYGALRAELVELHGLLWLPDRGGPYRKRWRPEVPGPAVVPPPVSGARPLSGRLLRRAVLTSLRDADRPMTLTEIHRALHLSGHCLTSDHPVKQLADALRYEEQRVRVRRVSRGTYVLA